MSDLVTVEHPKPWKLSKVGIRWLGPVDYEDWTAIGCWLQRTERALPWAIGDWLNYGEGAYGEKAAQALDATDWTLKTLEVYAWVCRRMPAESRREDLTFSHHQTVAALQPKEQQRWLEKAELGHGDGSPWSVTELKQALRAAEEHPRQLWVVASVTSQEDADELVKRLESEGRSVKTCHR